MRISDWSSDVCSSDLGRKSRRAHRHRHQAVAESADRACRARQHIALAVRQTPRGGYPGSTGQGGETAATRRHGMARCAGRTRAARLIAQGRSEEHTSELQSLMRSSYAVFCLKKKQINVHNIQHIQHRETNIEHIVL